MGPNNQKSLLHMAQTSGEAQVSPANLRDSTFPDACWPILKDALMFNEFSERAFGFNLAAVLIGLEAFLHLGKHPVDSAVARSLIDLELMNQLVEVFVVHALACI
jgi:hypothetical protein